MVTPVESVRCMSTFSEDISADDKASLMSGFFADEDVHAYIETSCKEFMDAVLKEDAAMLESAEGFWDSFAGEILAEKKKYQKARLHNVSLLSKGRGGKKSFDEFSTQILNGIENDENENDAKSAMEMLYLLRVRIQETVRKSVNDRSMRREKYLDSLILGVSKKVEDAMAARTKKSKEVTDFSVADAEKKLVRQRTATKVDSINLKATLETQHASVVKKLEEAHKEAIRKQIGERDLHIKELKRRLVVAESQLDAILTSRAKASLAGEDPDAAQPVEQVGVNCRLLDQDEYERLLQGPIVYSTGSQTLPMVAPTPKGTGRDYPDDPPPQKIVVEQEGVAEWKARYVFLANELEKLKYRFHAEQRRRKEADLHCRHLEEELSVWKEKEAGARAGHFSILAELKHVKSMLSRVRSVEDHHVPEAEVPPIKLPPSVVASPRFRQHHVELLNSRPVSRYQGPPPIDRSMMSPFVSPRSKSLLSTPGRGITTPR
jgi:hypothetical protein